MADRFIEIIGQLVAQLTHADKLPAATFYERLLEQLAMQFESDRAFLRHHHPSVGTSALIAEWPPRKVASQATTDPIDTRQFWGGSDESSRVITGSNMGASTAVAPLRCGSLTTGVLGLTKPASKRWASEELDVLDIVAALLGQLQARVATERRLQWLAERDDLTGLHNRRALNREVRRLMQPGEPGPIAVLYADMDRLKSVNDLLGHQAGDAVIRRCGQRLAAAAGKDAMTARVGGDEFVVVPRRAMSVDAAQALARELQIAACRPLRTAGQLISRTVSIGVALGTPGVATGGELLKRADQAALAVKKIGGNGIGWAHDVSTREAGANRVAPDAHRSGLPVVARRPAQNAAVRAAKRD